MMDERVREQAAAATGIVALGLVIATFYLLGSAGFMGEEYSQETAEAALAKIAEEERTVRLAASLVALGGAFLLWFVGSLASRLRKAEAGPGRLAGIVWSAGALWAFSWFLAGLFFSGATEFATHERFAAGAKFALAAGGGLLGDPVMGLVPATMLLATAYLSLRTAALPRWLAWFSGLTGAALVASALGSGVGVWLGMLGLLLPIWLLVASAVLVREAGN